MIDDAASRAALITLTKSVAPHLAQRGGVRADVVAPGPTWTPLNEADQNMPPDGLAHIGSEAPLGRAAAGGDRADLRLPRLRRRLQLHHRRGDRRDRRHRGHALTPATRLSSTLWRHPADVLRRAPTAGWLGRSGGTARPRV
ncbi:SDR family oxidoreductase [Streptomyces caniscabiei]|uniref:SDR family oxidoreductase n=1 Tax=Streptomyces caniscabiei TaxID=2746961 RepID=UPI0029BDB9E2|nr:SDR family oxidoreductase [Streptomyces caniscabiei]MDX3727374.1 SDR family oxidoreductase [Streptomyces caniscabiei]